MHEAMKKYKKKQCYQRVLHILSIKQSSNLIEKLDKSNIFQSIDDCE